QLRDDLVYRRGRTVYRKGNVVVAQRAITLAIAGEVELDHGNAFTADVPPDVQLGPMQERMHAQVGARRQVGVEVIPELRRLVSEVPFAGIAPGAEYALFRPYALFVPSDSGDDSLEPVL